MVCHKDSLWRAKNSSAELKYKEAKKETNFCKYFADDTVVYSETSGTLNNMTELNTKSRSREKDK